MKKILFLLLFPSFVFAQITKSQVQTVITNRVTTAIRPVDLRAALNKITDYTRQADSTALVAATALSNYQTLANLSTDLTASATKYPSVNTVITALSLKSNTASPTFTGTVILPSTTSVGSVSATELGYLDNVTSAIQTQIDAKSPTASPTFTGTVVLPSTISVGSITSTELGYVDGVTSAIQTQIDAKAPLASPTFTGTPSLPTGTTGVTQSAGNSATALATTAFVTTADNLKLNLTGGTLTGRLTLAAGSTAAGSAGLVIPVSSAVMTTPEAGAVEALGDKLYYNIPTGPARTEILLGSANGLSSGTVPYASTNGRLTTSSTFTFATSAGGRLGVGTTAATSNLNIGSSVQTSGVPTLATFTDAAHTGITASTEAPSIDFNLASTKQFATGALTNQRAIRITAPTYSAVGASTITNASTVDIDNAPQAGANVTLTNPNALRVRSGNVQFDGTFSTAAIPTLGSITSTELGFVDGVTSAIQTQLDSKAANVLTGYTSGAGTVASTDNVLQAIQKLNGNDALKVSLAGTETITGDKTLSGATTLSGTTTVAGLTSSAGITFSGSGGAINLASTTVWLGNVYSAAFSGKTGVALATGSTGGALLFREISSGNEMGGFFGTSRNMFLQDPGAVPTDDGVNKLQVIGSVKATQYRLSALNTAPASATATGTLGEIRVTTTGIYICTATNTWIKCTGATF